jgi:hypothetical protein
MPHLVSQAVEGVQTMPKRFVVMHHCGGGFQVGVIHAANAFSCVKALSVARSCQFNAA